MISQKIASDLKTLWSDLWEFDYILITGGGGIVIYPYLTNIVDVKSLQVIDDGQFANVNGYLKIGQRSF